MKGAKGSVQFAAVSPDPISQTFSIPIGKPSGDWLNPHPPSPP